MIRYVTLEEMAAKAGNKPIDPKYGDGPYAGQSILGVYLETGYIGPGVDIDDIRRRAGKNREEQKK